MRHGPLNENDTLLTVHHHSSQIMCSVNHKPQRACRIRTRTTHHKWSHQFTEENSPNTSQFLLRPNFNFPSPYRTCEKKCVPDHTSKTEILSQSATRNWTDASSTKPKKQVLRKKIVKLRRKSTWHVIQPWNQSWGVRLRPLFTLWVASPAR